MVQKPHISPPWEMGVWLSLADGANINGIFTFQLSVTESGGGQALS
jgi:hypothetical protein